MELLVVLFLAASFTQFHSTTLLGWYVLEGKDYVFLLCLKKHLLR